jgi:hypothetical protein
MSPERWRRAPATKAKSTRNPNAQCLKPPLCNGRPGNIGIHQAVDIERKNVIGGFLTLLSIPAVE